MVSSFRLWVVSSFCFILLVCIAVSGIVINYLNKSKSLENYHSVLKNTRILLYETNKLKEEILLAAINQSELFYSDTSFTDKKFWNLNKQITGNINYLGNAEITNNYEIKEQINQLKSELFNFISTYKVLIHLYKLKGFKDYGLEGIMRNYAHDIYDYNNNSVKLNCLMLRRHEKDFLLRKDLQYVHQFNLKYQLFTFEINESELIGTADKKILLRNLYSYHKCFTQLAKIEIQIGVKGKSGQLEKSERSFNEIALLVEKLDTKIKEIIETNREKFKTRALILAGLLFVVILIIIILLSNILTKSIKNISVSFGNYINSGFNFEALLTKRSLFNEFNIINDGFIKMAKEIHIFTNFFKEKVHERTLEITQQKEAIQAQQAEIESQNIKLTEKVNELFEQKRLLSQKNDAITDSLRYAKRIQNAFLSSATDFKKIFSDSFVFYKPRDVVSGDFYLAHQLSGTNNGSTVFFAAGDCTGHGVPGAMLSVLGINIINELVKEGIWLNPGNLLNILNSDFNKIFVQGRNNSSILSDGMDISVFSFDKETYQLEYCIAHFPHLLVRDSEVLTLNYFKMGIGFTFIEREVEKFETQVFQLKPGDCLYVFSDGFCDQFGGPLHKKFKKTRLVSLIESIHHLDMKIQKALIKEAFYNWKRNTKQTDDVTVIGIRF